MMKRIELVLVTLAMAGMMITQVNAVPADAEIISAATDTKLLKALLAGKTAEEAANITAAVMNAAIKLGGSDAELQKRIARVAAAAIAASGDNGEAVARALVRSAGAEHTSIVVAAIALAVGDSDHGKNIVNAAMKAAPGGQKESAETAAKNPVVTLRLLTPFVIAAVTGDPLPFPPPPVAEKYQAQ